MTKSRLYLPKYLLLSNILLTLRLSHLRVTTRARNDTVTLLITRSTKAFNQTYYLVLSLFIQSFFGVEFFRKWIFGTSELRCGRENIFIIGSCYWFNFIALIISWRRKTMSTEETMLAAIGDFQNISLTQTFIIKTVNGYSLNTACHLPLLILR
jgi:hypothetical protein